MVYLSYSKPSEDGTRNTTAVIRARFANDRLNDVQEIFEANAWSQGLGHYGSRLAFDKDNYLFITVGDRQVPPAGDLEKHPAQDLMVHNGKVIRLHDDGRVPTDNPFVGRADALPQIWSYGHRNPQGMIVHPTTNQVWATEHGPQGGDEFNLVQAGKNYGWPVIGFGVNYRSGTAIHSGTTRAGMEQPVKVWVPSIATSGLLAYTGDRFPEWKGSVFTGSLVGESLVRLTLDGVRVTSDETLIRGRGRIRDVRQGTDGLIYLAIEDRMGQPTGIWRLEPVTR
jgi:glucose/arabinose dehydrogenase